MLTADLRSAVPPFKSLSKSLTNAKIVQIRKKLLMHFAAARDESDACMRIDMRIMLTIDDNQQETFVDHAFTCDETLGPDLAWIWHENVGLPRNCPVAAGLPRWFGAKRLLLMQTSAWL